MVNNNHSTMKNMKFWNQKSLDMKAKYIIYWVYGTLFHIPKPNFPHLYKR